MAQPVADRPAVIIAHSHNLPPGRFNAALPAHADAGGRAEQVLDPKLSRHLRCMIHRAVINDDDFIARVVLRF